MSSKDNDGRSGGERRRVSMIAVAWFVRMRSSERTAEDERKFQNWISEDDRHAEAYAEIENVWTNVGTLTMLPGYQAIRQEALKPPTNVFARIRKSGDFLKTALGPPRRAGWTLAAGLAAVLVLMITVTAVNPSFLRPGTGLSHQTALGERKTITLTDGSLITLTSDSRVTAIFSDHRRRIILSKGEAYFDVSRDSARPFSVEAGSGAVTALGTEFDVYKKNGEVVVTLVEGSIEVETLNQPQSDEQTVRRLKPGQRLSYDEGGVMEVREVNIAQAVAWRTGRIDVSGEPLLDVIDEMNRHSSRKLKVNRSDPRLRNLLVTGQFKTGRPEDLVQYIRAAGINVWTMKDSAGNIKLRLHSDSSRG